MQIVGLIIYISRSIARYNNENNTISSWPVASKSTLMIPNNFLCICSENWQQDFRQNVVRIWQKRYVSINITNCFITVLVDRYNNQLLPLLRQFLLILSRINKFMDLRTNCSTPRFHQFWWNLISTWWFVSFQLFNSHLKLKGIWFGH